jgi:AcrR family transcriptional regulator
MLAMGQSRDRVVETSLRMFADNGYSAVSMRDLAKALGIQAPSIYSHFESKDALLAAIVGPFIEAMRDLLDGFPAGSVSPSDRRAWLTEAITLLAAHPRQLHLVTGDRSLAQHPMFGPQLRDIRSLLIERLIRAGAVDSDRAVAIIGAIVYSLLPRSESADLEPEPADVPKVVRMVEVFLDAG